MLDKISQPASATLPADASPRLAGPGAGDRPGEGTLAHLPLSGPERLVIPWLADIVRDRDILLVACARLESLARLLASTANPTTRVGVGSALAFAALAMLHGTRPALDVDDYLAKDEHASVRHRCRHVRLSLALRTCMAADAPGDSPWANPELREAAILFKSEGLAGQGAASITSEPDPGECQLFEVLGRMWQDRDGFRNAISRLRFLREAVGLGLGWDPDLVEGLSLALDALVLLYAARPSATRAEAREKRAVLADHPCRGDDHVGAVLASLLEADRVALGLMVEDLA